MIVCQKVYWKRPNKNDVSSKVIPHYVKVDVVKSSANFKCNAQKCYDMWNNAYL